MVKVFPMNLLKVGATARILRITGAEDIRRRLMEMGFCRGTLVKAVRRAPFGDPIEFLLRGYYVSLREEEAMRIEVHPQIEVE